MVLVYRVSVMVLAGTDYLIAQELSGMVRRRALVDTMSADSDPTSWWPLQYQSFRARNIKLAESNNADGRTILQGTFADISKQVRPLSVCCWISRS
jgi:hypothetical protein